MANEIAIEQSFKRWCTARELPCLKLVLSDGRGWPDRAILIPGNIVCWIEFKDPTGELSPHQKYWISKAEQAGHQIFVCTSVGEAIEAVTRLSEISQRVFAEWAKDEKCRGAMDRHRAR